MPGPETHHVFYKELKNYLNKDVLGRLANYDKYSIFAQGHDFLIYHNFYKIFNRKRLEKNLFCSQLLQEFHFADFVYCYIKNAADIGVLENEQIKLFLWGYIGHHMLDAYTHPFIIYYSGDHIRTPQNTTWNHGIVENLIDIYMIEDKQYRRAPVYRDFVYDKNLITKDLKIILDNSLKEIYGINKGGEIFFKAFTQIELFMRMFKYDRWGLKRILFDMVDPVLKGTASFSYNRNIDEVKMFLNEKHELWINPMFGHIKSNESFMDLYKKALKHTSKIINQLESMFIDNIVCKNTICSIVPNIASTHGMECGRKIEIKYKKQH